VVAAQARAVVASAHATIAAVRAARASAHATNAAVPRRAGPALEAVAATQARATIAAARNAAGRDERLARRRRPVVVAEGHVARRTSTVRDERWLSEPTM
jgi:hypothetical protein